MKISKRFSAKIAISLSPMLYSFPNTKPRNYNALMD